MEELYHIVTNFKLINKVKLGSKYFRVNLGLASHKENHAGDKVLNDTDKFAYFYNSQYKTVIYGQGHIGNIRFYTDHYIREDILAVYYNFEEFIIDWDFDLESKSGIDAMIGKSLKYVNEEYKNRIDEIERKRKQELEKKKQGNPELILTNPGGVTYEDLKEYMIKKNSNRKI